MGRILILANSDAGLYKFRRELVVELLKENEVFISLPDGEYIKELVDLGCKFVDTKVDRRGTNPITDLKLTFLYKKIIGRIKPDVVLSYTIKPNIYGGIICRFAKIPYMPNVTGLGTAVEGGGLLQNVAVVLYRFAFKDAYCIFFQNNENADFMNGKGIVKGKQTIIPGSGVNLDYFRKLEYPEDETVNFLFISRVMQQKGIDQYLEAAEQIRSEYPNTRFHVLGSCEEAYEDKLAEMQEKGIIQYHGMQKDIRGFQKISHCTIHPTYYPEGMSNVLLESAACGRPIITTNRSGCREIVDDGINGYVVEQQNSRDLIEKVRLFLNLNHDEKIKMGLAGRTKVEKYFDRRIVVENYMQEIENIFRGL